MRILLVLTFIGVMRSINDPISQSDVLELARTVNEERYLLKQKQQKSWAQEVGALAVSG